MSNRIGQALVAIATAFGVAACGGGGGGSSAGIDRLGVSSGTITGFGSIFVNGVEWRTNGADIEVDDQPGTESSLRLGQVVVVRGTLDAGGTSGSADSISFDNEIEGPVTAIDPAAGSFVVLGQTVLVVPDTVFDDSIAGGFAGLAVGALVEVSGYRDATGAIRATRIERQEAGEDAEARGLVSGLDTGNQTFQLGNLAVNYAGATLEDFGSDTLSNGDIVEVEGNFAGGVLVADTVEREDDLSGEDGDESEVEGYVTQVFSATDFEVAGIRVTTNAGTEFEGGTAADIALDAKVEAEGEFNAAGLLVADKVEFRVSDEDTDVEIAGAVTAVSTQAGTFQIEGVLVRTTPTTLWEDDSSAALATFGLADLDVGDYVEIRGAEDPSATANDVIATRVERDDSRDEATLRGPIQAENEPDLTVLGVTISTDTAVFRDEDDNPIDEATFFATVGVGDVVEAKTDTLAGFNDTSFIAEEVEIEEID